MSNYKWTYKDITTGEVVTKELSNGKDAYGEFLSEQFDSGNLYFTIFDLSGKSKEIPPKVNLNPKFRKDGE